MRLIMHTEISNPIKKLIASFIISILVFVAIPVTPAFAAEIVTTSTTDELMTNGQCSLREAIINANNDAATYPDCDPGSGADIITLTSGETYYLTLGGSGPEGQSLDVSNTLTIQTDGSAPATIDASSITDRVFLVASGDLTLNNTIVQNGNSSFGSGIRFDSTGTLTLTNSTIANNTGTAGGACGAGIYSLTATSISISKSAIANNVCTTLGGDGGGIYYGNTVGTFNITNTTFYNNSAGPTPGGNGGGMLVDVSSGTIAFSTFSDNTISGEGGAVQVKGGTIAISQSILANSNGANDCQRSGGSVDSSTSLIETNALSGVCGAPASSNVDPGLGAFQDNGGSTFTMAIQTDSVAFDSASTCTGSNDVDQRGLARPESVACDLGAFELDNVDISFLVDPVIGIYGDSVNLTATVTETVVGSPVEGISIDFKVNGVSAGSANTNASGIATLIGITLTDNVGLYNGGVGSGIEASFAGDSFYNASAGSADLTINQRPLTVTGVTANDKVYDGTTAATLVTSGASLVGIVGADDVTLDDTSAIGVFVDENVGTNKTVIVSGFALNGTDAGNYSLVQPTGITADITASEFMQIFDDVPTNFWAAHYIQAIYDAGITAGCSTTPPLYCPTTIVTRAQMAVFLLKAEHGSAYTPPTPTGIFNDVPTNFWAAAWIEQLATESVTGGCGNGNYCPNNSVTRDQMAVFLTKTFGLPIP